MKVLLASIFSFLISPNLCFAYAIPSTTPEVLKLVIQENGHQTLETVLGTKISILDWFLSNAYFESQDLTETGTLFHRISDAKCIEKDSTVQCQITYLAQEFVPRPNNPENYCQGADYGDGILVVFAIVDSTLKFLSAEQNISLGGDGPCGANW